MRSGHDFLAGPPLVKAATGEEVCAEELGGETSTPAAQGSSTISPTTTPGALRDRALDRRDARSAAAPRRGSACETVDPPSTRRGCSGVVPVGAAHRL